MAVRLTDKNSDNQSTNRKALPSWSFSYNKGSPVSVGAYYYIIGAII